MATDTGARPAGVFSRRVVTIVVVSALLPAFAATQLIIARYRSARAALAAEWSARGNSDLTAARPAVAVTDFETAMAYGSELLADRFSLAKALVAANRLEEARAQLTALLTDEPARGDVNLELARIAAHQGDIGGAIRYYDASIDGTWDANALVERRQIRLELAQWLMANGQQGRAQAELIALVDELPPNAEQLTNAGDLLARAGAGNRALSVYKSALQLDPDDAHASRMAGELEFHDSNFRSAEHDLSRAGAKQPLDEAGARMLAVSRDVLALDPYLPGIGSRGRAERAERALTVSEARLARCARGANTDAQQAQIAALATQVTALTRGGSAQFARDPDAIDKAVAAIGLAARLPQDACGNDTAEEAALALISASGIQPSWDDVSAG